MLGTTALSVLITVAVRAFALPMALAVAKRWTWFYSAAVPITEQEARRAEIQSDLHEQVADCRAEGYQPAEIAFHVLLRVVRGVIDDLAWSAPYLSSMLAEQFERGSESLRNVRTLTPIISAMAVLGMMNASLAVSDGDRTWTEWLRTNGVVLAAIVLMWNQQHRWARRIFHSSIYLAIFMAVGVLLWMVLNHRLYEIPTFSQSMFQFGFAMLPMVLGMVVSSETCRTRVFKGHWWPVYVSWILITAISLGTAVFVGLKTSMTIWATMALLAAALFILGTIFISGSAIICHGGLKASAGCMRLMAAGIRHLSQG